MEKKLLLFVFVLLSSIGCSTVPDGNNLRSLDHLPIGKSEFKDFRRIFLSKDELELRMQNKVCEVVAERAPARGGQVPVGEGLALLDVLDYAYSTRWAETPRVVVISERSIIHRPQIPHDLTDAELNEYNEFIVRPGDIVYVNMLAEH